MLDGKLILEANAPREIEDLKRSRIFNLVSIFAVIPMEGALTCRIWMQA